MIRRGVWQHLQKNTIPENRRLIGAKWVFKVKHGGTYRARCVALGYPQIPGVDYTENFSPVVNNVTLREALIIILQKRWSRRNLEVETEFLDGDL